MQSSPASGNNANPIVKDHRTQKSAVPLFASGYSDEAVSSSCEPSFTSGATNLKRIKRDSFQYHRKMSALDTALDPPSFDLGIQLSQTYHVPINANTEVIHPIKTLSLIPFSLGSQDVSTASGYHAQLSPKSDDSKVLYYQKMYEDNDKCEMPASPTCCIPWSDVHHHRSIESSVAETVYNNFELDTNEACEWLQYVIIAHLFPRYLSLTALQLKHSFTGHNLCHPEVVDAIIRRFNQLDSVIEVDDYLCHWCHFFDTDFAMVSLAGLSTEVSQSVFNQFVQSDYCLPLCQMRR
ncbi:hypothetical protein BS78_10G177700 [Paspalum vaginatum]|nr:hypothetical protein BS78_10G177700 [Paspalum vaginatum]